MGWLMSLARGVGLDPHRFSFGKSHRGENYLIWRKSWKYKSWNSLLVLL